MKKIISAICCMMAVMGTYAGTLQVTLEPEEYWWGGHIDDGMLMPYSAKKPYRDSLIDKGYGVSCYQPNQCQGLLLSSKGRYVWSDEPFSFAFQNGMLTAEGAATFDTGRSETKTLKGAFLAASKKYFPASGKMPDATLFSAPQWNTWIELTYNQNEKDLLAYAESILKNGFDPGVLMIDDTWQEDYGVWEFHPGRFPHPKAMCDKLHAMGFKIMLWICPYVSTDSRVFREQLWPGKGVLRDANRPNRPAIFNWWNGYSACVDFSSPHGVTWFKAQLTRLQKEYGVDGFKLDAGDMHLYAPERYLAHSPAEAASHKQCKLFASIGLEYPLNEYRACWQLAGQPLAQRLHDKAHSWYDVRQCVADMIAQGLEGYTFNCPDMVGGGNWTSFLPGKKINFKMIVRSAQVHALMPMMQFSVNPWRIMTRPEDKKYLDAILKAAAIRKAHTTQILQLAKDSAKTGEPIIRHLDYVFPGEGLEEVRDEFVLGDDLIVAPVVDESDTRTVRLPSGTWKGDDGVSVTGPVTLTLKDIPLDRIPRFTRVKMMQSLFNKAQQQAIQTAELVNFGSGPSAYAFEYQRSGVHGFNFGMTPSSFSMEQKLFDEVVSLLPRGCAVALTVCPFSFGENRGDSEPRKRYSRYFRVFEKAPAADTESLWFPYGNALEENGCGADLLATRTADMLNIWSAEFDLRLTKGTRPDMESIMTRNKAAFETTRAQLLRLYDAFQKKGFRPFVLLPPLAQVLRDRLSPEILDVFLYSNIRKLTGLRIADYSARMEDSCFCGPVFLSRDGAAKFTRMVADEMRNRRSDETVR